METFDYSAIDRAGKRLTGSVSAVNAREARDILRAQTLTPIDLRAANDLRKSYLLHRLNLLEITWGKLQPTGPDSQSSFKEIWLLEWQPEFNLLLLERSSYGNTIPQAAGRFTLEAAQEINPLL